MLETTKTLTLNGESKVETEGEMIVAAFMNATISGNGQITISKSIANTDAYNTNKETVQADMIEFEEKAYEETSKNNIS